MADAIPAPAGPSIPGGHRRRLLVLIGLLALGAGGTGALAATVIHRGDTPASPSAGPSVYIPYAGQQGVSGSTGAPAQGIGIAQAPSSATAQGVAQSGSASSAYPYPGPGVCTGIAPAQVSGQVVTATGTSSIPAGSPAALYVLDAWINAQSQAGVGHAVTNVQQRLAAVTTALVSAGVPRGSIHTSSVNVYASSGGGRVGAGGILPAASQPSAATTVNASASLTAQLPDAGTVDRAVSAAANAGADNVNVSTQTPAAGPPSPDALSAALAQASDQAHQLAAAAARATGVNLGAVRSVSSQQPTVCGYGADGPQLVVGVTVAYAIA